MSKSPLTLFLWLTLLFSCSKDDEKDRDTIPPVVTLNGNANETINLNTSYTDPGATATDNADGTVAVTSDYSNKNPNADSAATYMIKYTAKDNNGNKGYAYRYITVQNESQSFEGNYIVTSISNGDTVIYNQTVRIDKNINNRIYFSDLGNYSNNSKIYAACDSNGLITIPLQYAVNIGSDQGQPCDVVNHSFESTIGAVNANGFTIEYIDAVTVPSTCMTVDTVVAVFVKQ
jgi:hypothetical protein